MQMKDYKKLKSIIEEIDTLIASRVMSDHPQFSAWKLKTERFLSHKYGTDSIEYGEFGRILFSPGVWTFDTADYIFRNSCADGLREAKAMLTVYLEEMEEDLDNNSGGSTSIPAACTANYRKVFIVHGHNGEMKEAVARLIEKQGIQAIILHEQANLGATIIEKFENYSDVGGAVCLFTADDLGRAKRDAEDKKRARQNVVFETGYFIGKLGRNNVILIADKGVEIPSDLQGVVYTETSNWQFSVLKELKAIGYSIDYNKLD